MDDRERPKLPNGWASISEAPSGWTPPGHERSGIRDPKFVRGCRIVGHSHGVGLCMILWKGEEGYSVEHPLSDVEGTGTTQALRWLLWEPDQGL